MTAPVADRLVSALVACAYLALVAAIDPAGEFPLNDDWSYAWSVKALLEDGRLAFTGWVSMPRVAQVLWGWLFTLPAGFSFTALRLSAVVLAVVAGLAVYAAVRLTTARRRPSRRGRPTAADAVACGACRARRLVSGGAKNG